MSFLGSAWQRRTLRWSLVSALAGLATQLFVACDLNPQPEVPSAGPPKDGGGGISAGGTGGGIGTGGASVGGAAGSGFGGNGASGGISDAATEACASPCGAGQICDDGVCKDDPCDPNLCSAGEACKPNADFSAHACSVSCADVSCSPTETCVDGNCEPTGCTSACATGEICLGGGDGGYACQPDPCASDAAAPCSTGSVCDPFTLACVEDPCKGVKCPASQLCIAGECRWPASTDAGSD